MSHQPGESAPRERMLLLLEPKRVCDHGQPGNRRDRRVKMMSWMGWDPSPSQTEQMSMSILVKSPTAFLGD